MMETKLQALLQQQRRNDRYDTQQNRSRAKSSVNYNKLSTIQNSPNKDFLYNTFQRIDEKKKSVRQQSAVVAKTPEIETECPICMKPMMEPVKLPCKHTFCINCIRISLKYKKECPLDRIRLGDDFKFQIDRTLQQKIQWSMEEKQDKKENYDFNFVKSKSIDPSSRNRYVSTPNFNQVRRSALGQQSQNKKSLFFEKIDYEFEIGNTHKKIKKSHGYEHEWKCYFKACDPEMEKKIENIIEGIDYQLYKAIIPTIPVSIFKDPIQYKQKDLKLSLRIKCKGSGQFDIPIAVYFKQSTGIVKPLFCTMNLSFHSAGMTQKIRMSFDKKNIGDALGQELPKEIVKKQIGILEKPRSSCLGKNRLKNKNKVSFNFEDDIYYPQCKSPI